MAELEDDAKLDVSASHEGSSVVLRVTGELDLSTTPVLREAIAAAGDPATGVVFDLSAVTFMDSSGLSVFLEVAASGRSIRLQSPSDTVRRVIETTGVGETLGIES